IANLRIPVTFANVRSRSKDRQVIANCVSINTTKIRCRSDSLTYTQIRALGIERSLVEQCPGGAIKSTTEHALKASYTVTDAAANAISSSATISTAVQYRTIPSGTHEWRGRCQ
ncbi:MAG: hypothetical protein K8963_00015, partial [Proteobacteria bacterium]|nr:hypothetical protein [Pseudomonadota bacterium]